MKRSSDERLDEESSIKKKLKINKNFIELLENQTRIKIFWLLMVYGRLSLTKIAEKIGVTKQAISIQIRKFVELGIVQVIKQQVRGSIKANLYELEPNFSENAIIKIDYQSDIPHEDTKELSILEMPAQRMLYHAIHIFFEQTSSYYQLYEEKYQNSESPFPIKPPIFSFSGVPLSKSELEKVKDKIDTLTSDIYKDIINERENEPVWEERPYLLINTFLPIKEIVENKELQKRKNK